MFDTLSDRLGGVFRQAQGPRPRCVKQDVARCHSAKCASPLLEADVALPVPPDASSMPLPKRLSGRMCCARSRPASRSSRSSMTN